MGGAVSVPYKKLGAWVDRSGDLVAGALTAQALTDGFVMGYHDTQMPDIYGFTDSATPPTTQRWHVRDDDGNTFGSIFMIVRKNDYWRVTGLSHVFWIPLEP